MRFHMKSNNKKKKNKIKKGKKYQQQCLTKPFIIKLLT